ncbi:hypothetical protein DRO02_03345 [archaeon]|nr:MAG: hypothetical protein DRO21_04275 [archaeon]RLG64849.1 MAG: hypothetical protein DRO02_03345 [archaeon]HDM23414.1 hypothetical protein [Candidatus Bathyarchaeota archaeon]
MTVTLKLAKIFAKEIIYRSRKTRRKSFFYDPNKPISLWKNNLVQIIAFAFPSICIGGACVNLYLETGSFLPLVLGLGFLGVLQAGVAGYSVASIVNMLIEHRLIEPLLTRPISISEVWGGVILAGLLYWGVLTSFALVIPMVALIVYVTGNLLIILTSILMIAALTIMAFGIGFMATALSPGVKRSRILRGVTVVIWLLAFVAGYFYYFILLKAIKITTSENLLLLFSILPPFNFIMVAFNPTDVRSALSMIVWSALMVILLIFSTRRCWRALFVGEFIAFSLPSLGVKTVKRQKIVDKGVLGFMFKDLKILARNTQRLSRFMYGVLMPIAFIAPVLVGVSFKPSIIAPAVAGLSGACATVGLSVSELVYCEGRAAPLLYTFPLTRRKIAYEKSLVILPISLVYGMLLSAVMYISTGNFLSAIACLVNAVVVSFGTSYAMLTLILRNLPSIPSEWSEYSIELGGVALRVIISLLAIFVGSASAMIFYVMDEFYFSPIVICLGMLMLNLMIRSFTPDKPLTG